MPVSAPATHLPDTVRKLGWVSFWADVSSEMVYPLLGLFMTRILGAPLFVLGFVEGSAEAVVSLMKGVGGVRSDQTGRRLPWVQWGYGLSAIGKPLLAFAQVWPIVLFARTTDRVGKGLRSSARDALIVDAVTPETRGRAFGYHRAMDTAGALLGTFTTWVVLLVAPNPLPAHWFRTLFIVAGIPGLISLYLTFRIRENKHDIAPGPDAIPFRTLVKMLPGKFWAALAVTTLFCLANSSDTFLLLKASAGGLSDAAMVGVAGLYNIVYALVSYPAGVWSDRIGRWRILVLGWVLYAAVYAGFALWAGGIAGFLVLFAFYGLYIGLTKAVGTALVADLAPAEIKGSALGLFAMVNGFATIGASALTGLLWDRVNSSTALAVDAALALVAALLAVLVVGRRAGSRGVQPAT